MAREKIKTALQNMPETGVNGFEGLTVKFLELVLKERFILARSGDQPSGDAHNVNRNICLQAKRYTETKLNAKNIEGDFDGNLRAVPETDVYVLAVTKNTAQLDDTLDAMRDKSGVDIIVWDFDSENSALLTLCIEFWDQLQMFDCIKALDVEVKPWINNSRQTEIHKHCFQLLSGDLLYHAQTFASTRKAGNSYLELRFSQKENGGLLQSFPIDLDKSIQRKKCEEKVLCWWQNTKEKLVTLVGEEGMGKSWLAASCARHISFQTNTLVFWLDSLHWQNCHTLEQVLNEIISRLKIGDEKKAVRLVRKIRSVWSLRTLIVLDGVNERGSLDSAQHIIDDLLLKEPGGCRILFTTRPLAWMPGYAPILWKQRPEINIGRFDNEEFKAALAKITPPVELAEIPEQLALVARIPRYFHTCLKLRAKLKGFTNVSLSLVVWTDLLDKIAGLEPQLRLALGWTRERDAVEVLVELAKNSPCNAGNGIAQDFLNRCFSGKYADIRHYLVEVRILIDAGNFQAQLSPAHTTLGKAFFLRELIRGLQCKTVLEISDRLRRELEPLSGEDGAAEALFVALQLSALQDEMGSSSVVKTRAGLLHAWLLCHNSVASDERLAFWADYDTSSYSEFTEAFFERSYEGNAQLFVVKPLAKVWKNNQSQREFIKPYLRRWLLLVWSEECLGAPHYLHKGHQLPVAATPDQVRLTAIALSIISLHLDNTLLPDVALCHATVPLTWRKFKAPGATERNYPFKSVEKNLGILMRWGYTEKVIPELERLACNHAKDELMLHGLLWLARVLRQVDLPAILQMPPETSKWPYVTIPAADLIRQRQRLFVPREEGKPFLGNQEFSYLAVRKDLPPIADEDILYMTETFERICSNLIDRKEDNFDHHEFETWWAWYAKFKPNDLAKLAGQLQLHALKLGEPKFFFMLLQGIPIALNEQDQAEWLESVYGNFQRPPINIRQTDYLALLTLETLCLSMPLNIIREWVVYAGLNTAMRANMFYGPIDDILPLVMGSEIARVAIEKCQNAPDKTFSPWGELPTEFEYWCYIAGLFAKPDNEICEWAKRFLLDAKFPNKRNFYLLRLWMLTSRPGDVEATINCTLTSHFFDDEALRAWCFIEDRSLDFHLIQGTYDQLIRGLPKGFAGMVFAHSGRMTDLKRWGDELFFAATNHLGKSPIFRQSRAATELVVEKDDKLKWIRFNYQNDRPRASSNSVSSWGVDHGSLNNVLQNANDFEDRFNQEFEKWRLDEIALSNWNDSILHSFAAWGTLELYRKLDQEAFKIRARVLLKKAMIDLKAQFHIGGFLHALVVNMLPDSPRESWDYFVALNQGSLGVHVTSQFDIPEFYAKLWNTNVCALAEHSHLRMHLFEECKNEFEIMTLTIAAIANNAYGGLIEIVRQFLKSDLAMNRALAVSILAWVDNDDSICILTELRSNDKSHWVRKHAQWSIEVCLQEKSAREHFRQTLHETDQFLFSAALQVLKPALSPVARWWYRKIQSEEKANGLVLDPKLEAIFESFWHHWESIHPSSVSAGGIKLDEYCRGEELDELKMPRIAPWWNF